MRAKGAERPRPFESSLRPVLPRVGICDVDAHVPIIPQSEPPAAAVLVGYAADDRVGAFGRSRRDDGSDGVRSSCGSPPAAGPHEVAAVPSHTPRRRPWLMGTRPRRMIDENFRSCINRFPFGTARHPGFLLEAAVTALSRFSTGRASAASPPASARRLVGHVCP
jgi:hypothetical protein